MTRSAEFTIEQTTAQPRRGNRRHHAIAILCFFLTGFSGLVYEICWIRRATLVFGSGTFAVSTVLAVFFLGLALGGWWFGRKSERIRRPLLVYALLEIGAGILAVASLFALDIGHDIYGLIYRMLSEHTVLLWLCRMALITVILVPPTFLMGGSLPLFCRQYVQDSNRVATTVGWLYATNTLGAAAGAAAAGFVLLPELGVWRSVLAAASLNIACGIVASRLRIETPESALTQSSRTPSPATTTTSKRLVGVLFFAIGFVALALEVIWSRYLGLMIPNSVYTYTITLTVVLCGIVLGSWLSAYVADRWQSLGLVFGLLQMLTGLTVLAVIHVPASQWRTLGNDFWLYGLVLLPPSILSGASFPLAMRLVIEDPMTAGHQVGRMVALNTLGGITGSLLSGFVGIPFAGLHTTLLCVTGISVITGVTAWLRIAQGTPLPARFVGILVAVGVWIAIPVTSKTRVPADFLAAPEQLIAYREGWDANLAAVAQGSERVLEINRLWQGTTARTHQIMAAHIPMLLHPEAKSVLVVGVGVGQASERFLMYDIERLDCVDIEPTIFEFVNEWFPGDWMNDSRVSLIPEDGRSYVSHSLNTYDIISLELGQVSRPGVASFYTADFYRQAQERLNVGGVLVQFVPIHILTGDQMRSVIRTFIEVFPNSVLFYNTRELLLIGDTGDRLPAPAAPSERLGPNPAAAADLDWSPWGGPQYYASRPATFAAGFLVGPAGLRFLAGSGPVYRDDQPVLEYSTAGGLEDDQRVNVLGNIAILRKHLTPLSILFDVDDSGWQLEQAGEVRELNLRALEASVDRADADIMLSRGDADGAISLLRQSADVHPAYLPVLRNLSLLLLQTQQATEAVSYLQRLVIEIPDDVAARTKLGETHFALGQFELAAEQFRAAAELQPDNATRHLKLGLAMLYAGHAERAIAPLERALSVDPQLTPAREALEIARQQLRPGVE